MFLSKNPNGKYYIYYEKPNGKRTSISTKTKLKNEALKFLTNFENEQKLRAQEKVISISLKNLLFEYLKYSETIHSKNTTLSIKSTVNSLNNYFGEIDFHSIDKNKLSVYLQSRFRNQSPYVSKREKAYLSGIYNWAISNGYATENFCKGIKNFRLPEKQPLYFNQDEFDKLIKSVKSEDLKDIILFAVNSGLRQMELLTLQWNQIDFKNRFLILDNRQHLTKSKKIRAIPLNLTALQVLTDREMNKINSYVFNYNAAPLKQDFMSKKFRKLVKAAKINPELNFHSLRHTFATWLIQKGASIYEVSKLLGHSDLRITEIYTHLQPEDLRNSIDLLNTK